MAAASVDERGRGQHRAQHTARCRVERPASVRGENRGFHIGDARLGGVRIFDARIKNQHDAQWRASNYQSRPITDFLTRASKFCRRVTNVKTPNRTHTMSTSACSVSHGMRHFFRIIWIEWVNKLDRCL